MEFYCWNNSFICTLRKKKFKLRFDFFIVSFLQSREIWDIVHSYCSLGLAPWANFLKNPFKSRISRRGVIRDTGFVKKNGAPKGPLRKFLLPSFFEGTIYYVWAPVPFFNSIPKFFKLKNVVFMSRIAPPPPIVYSRDLVSCSRMMARRWNLKKPTAVCYCSTLA